MKQGSKAGAGDDALERLFAAAREDAPAPSDALMARVLADAAQNATRPVAGVAQPSRVARRSFLAELAELLGGWQGVGGLATAAAAGIWIGLSGLSGTGSLPELVGLSSGDPAVELLPGTDMFDLAALGG